MKKKLAVLILNSLFLLLAAGIVQAQAPTTLGNVDILTFLNNLSNWLFYIILLVAVIYFLLAAYEFITSRGEEDKVKSARNFLLYAVIGVAVAFLARGFIGLVQRLIT